MNKPFVITEDQYNHDKMTWGKKEFIVYDNVCIVIANWDYLNRSHL